MSTRRVTVKLANPDDKGQVINVPETFQELLACVSVRLSIGAKRIFNENGAEIVDVSVLRDDDKLIATGGDAFHNGIVQKGASPVGMTTVQRCVAVTESFRDEWISLNVGGERFVTTRTTLTKDADSMLGRMFSTSIENDWSWGSAIDSSGSYLIDRSPNYFHHLLDYLRVGKIFEDKTSILQGVLEEAQFFGLTKAVEYLDCLLQDREASEAADAPLTRREFISLLVPTPTNSVLRCQGINLARANLSNLDLHCINFKQANLRGCDLRNANLEECCLNKADLQRANLDGANLRCVNMVRANCESATMRGCDFEDPLGKSSNLEGANMKHSILEDSHMSGVVLRVACLRNASLRRCDLQGAVLAGTDLENCDLTGSNLREANLRGSNLRGTILEDMQSPLHMSQTVT
eukprot:scpid82061/ scgid5315/ BTB/POZ domain-containing protein KCTD9